MEARRQAFSAGSAPAAAERGQPAFFSSPRLPAPAGVRPPSLRPGSLRATAARRSSRRTAAATPAACTVEPGRAYRLLARNAPDGEFFQLTVPDAPVTSARWVHGSCGVQAADAGSAAEAPHAARAIDAVLALSWQPAFCETRPGTPECRLLNAGALRAPAACFRCTDCGRGARMTPIAASAPRPRRARPVLALVRPAAGRLDADDPRPAQGGDARRRQLPRPPRMAEAWHLAEDRDAGRLFRRPRCRSRTRSTASAVGLLPRRPASAARFATADIRAAFDAAFGPGAGKRVEGALRRGRPPHPAQRTDRSLSAARSRPVCPPRGR